MLESVGVNSKATDGVMVQIITYKALRQWLVFLEEFGGLNSTDSKHQFDLDKMLCNHTTF
jgi:hypothetical protein